MEIVSAALFRCIGAKGGPQIYGRWGLSSCRQNGDDGVRDTLKLYGLADNARVAVERVLPQAVAQNYNSGASCRVFCSGKVAPDHGPKTKDVKIARGDPLPVHILSTSGRLQIHATGPAGNGSRHGGNIIAKVPPAITIDLDGIGEIGRAGDALHQRSQALRLRIRKRPQEDGVDHAEDGGVGADAQCQGEDHNRGIAGVLAQLFQRVA